MTNPGLVFPDAVKSLQALSMSVQKSSVPKATLALVEMRASQINGCSVCVDLHARQALNTGETMERLIAV
jgi:AhpD family alkylhydroperoxidase